MSNAIAQSRNPVIDNLSEYIFLKSVRENTGLIDGKIIFEGTVWDQLTYNFVFPLPVIRYRIENPDKKNIAK